MYKKHVDAEAAGTENPAPTTFLDLSLNQKVSLRGLGTVDTFSSPKVLANRATGFKG